MFKQNTEDQGGSMTADTTIGPSVKVEGDVKAVGNVSIQGEVIGGISTDKKVTIGQNAVVKADISASSADIAGKVEGKITVQNDLLLRSQAIINGDISTTAISIESGAQINGHLQMGGSTQNASQESASESAD